MKGHTRAKLEGIHGTVFRNLPALSQVGCGLTGLTHSDQTVIDLVTDRCRVGIGRLLRFKRGQGRAEQHSQRLIRLRPGEGQTYYQ